MDIDSPADLLAISEVRRWCRTGQAAQIRLAAEVSQAEIASCLDTQQPVVSNWERGKCAPTGKNAVRYHHLLRALANATSRAAHEGPYGQVKSSGESTAGDHSPEAA
jgi:DNA-binding transcriptional regulator YiaG